MTRRMLSNETGMYMTTISWRVDELKRNGRLAVVRVADCKISGRSAQYLTTDPALFPQDDQLKLFEQE